MWRLVQKRAPVLVWGRGEPMADNLCDVLKRARLAYAEQVGDDSHHSLNTGLDVA